MDKLAAIRSFIETVDAGGFSAAARKLGLSQPAVSQQVRALEEELGARLLNRSTRTLELTERGAAYLEHAKEILRRLSEADESVRALEAQMVGRIAIATPASIAEKLLADFFVAFSAEHPRLELDLALDVSPEKLANGGYDVALNYGRPQEPGLIARRLGTSRRCLLASPAYLDRFGRPERPEELSEHRFLAYRRFEPVSALRLIGPEGAEAVATPTIVMRSDSAQVLRLASEAGLGISDCHLSMAQPLLAAGRMELVLPEWRFPDQEIFVVYPSNRFTPLKVLKLVERMGAEIRQRVGEHTE